VASTKLLGEENLWINELITENIIN
jgi:hypothetical protein